jgi:hypothetical protein
MTPSETEQMIAALETLRLATETNAKEIEALKAKDEHFSGTHRAITQQVIPSLKSQVDLERAADAAKAAAILSDMAAIVNDLGNRMRRVEDNSLVEVTSDHGQRSLVPAAPLAAKVGLDSATKTEQAAADSKRALIWYRHPGLWVAIFAFLDYLYKHYG